VQYLITRVLLDIIEKGETIFIETTSFLINEKKLNASDLIKQTFYLKKSIIKLPMFCDLTNFLFNCSEEAIYLKVLIFLNYGPRVSFLFLFY
jgi:hypothetical protein